MGRSAAGSVRAELAALVLEESPTLAGSFAPVPVTASMS
jgi:hypothetical protein